MMRMNNIKMTTEVERKELLKKLHENAERHALIMKEAKQGYIKQAIRKLEERLEILKNGKVVDLSFNLREPVDHSEIYKNAIEMLEWNKSEIIQLQADEFRQLVRDEWDWTDSFLNDTAGFSVNAAKYLAEKSK